MVAAIEFRFDEAEHEYIELATGRVLPHVTGMLQRTGWVDDEWFTDQSRERGKTVHRLTADYDLGALAVADCRSEYRSYLFAHARAIGILLAGGGEFEEIELPRVHPVHLFGGRPDRTLVLATGLRAVLEIKTGPPSKSHQVQTALQAELVAPEVGLPPWALARFALYLKPTGKFRVVEHTERRDFDRAQEVIRACC